MGVTPSEEHVYPSEAIKEICSKQMDTVVGPVRNPGGSVRSYCKWLLHPAVQCTEECTHDLHLRIVDARAVQRSERPAVTDLRTAGGWGEQREMRRERREERGER